MKTFIDENFLLHSDAAKRLYHDFAAPEPILDYHCHLPPAQIASDHQFADLWEIWLAGDHYKWRALRTDGVEESLITGNASPKEKFLAYARTVPRTLRNPLYHWTHLELLRYFGIDDLLDESTAESIWHRANEMVSSPEFSVRSLLARSHVRAVCTTDDPCDDLSAHAALAASGESRFKMFPTFRPDKALQVDNPASFADWVHLLERASGIDCSRFDGFLAALEARHAAFHDVGARLSDHGLECCPGKIASTKKARKIFEAAMEGDAAEPDDAEKFAGFLMVFFGHLDASRGWTKQLHLGAMRGNNSRMKAQLGSDTGFDSIGDFPQARNLAAYLDALDSEGSLPKIVLYNLNPADNYVFATMCGNFQEGPAAGKIQFGSGWWFLDQKEAMTWQINALSNLGLLSRFVGMLTDSRSFLSYPRHEYFRRILCNILGREIADRELPADYDLVGNMVRDICYRNSRSFFGLPI
ncbi:MAG: glucuronate isomerase [Terrimicrobiaceae bacterium]